MLKVRNDAQFCWVIAWLFLLILNLAIGCRVDRKKTWKDCYGRIDPTRIREAGSRQEKMSHIVKCFVKFVGLLNLPK